MLYQSKTYVTQHIKMDQLGQNFKIDILLFPTLCFQHNIGTKSFEIGYCILKIYFIDDFLTDQWKFDLDKKAH